jgi:hypothetical protein
MNMVPLLIAMDIVFGFFLVRLATPVRNLRPRWAVLLLDLSLGAGGGIAVVSLLFFLLLVLHVASLAVMLLVEALLLLSVYAFVYVRQQGPADEPCRRIAAFWWHWVLGGALLVSLLAVGTAIAKLAQANLYGAWDAYDFWNLRAKFLAGPGEIWRRAFAPVGVAHPDYPLLISGFVGQLWKFSGANNSVLAPILTGAVYAIGVPMLLVSALAVARGTGSALLAGLILMTSRSFLGQTTLQYSDVPLSFYYLATLVLVVLSAAAEARRQRTVAVMAGAFASFAVWTKNEGLVFFALCMGSYALVFGYPRHGRAGVGGSPVWYALLGALPGLLAAGYFKLFLAPPNDLTKQTAVQALHQLLEFGRYLRIGRALIHYGRWLGVWWAHPALLLAILAVVLGIRIDERQARGVVVAGLTLVLLLAVYCGVFVVAPKNLQFLLDTTLERLYAQLWPSFVFAAFLVLARPEETLGVRPDEAPGRDPRSTPSGI